MSDGHVNTKQARNGEAEDEECCTGFSLPYDGITRTGSKGLSQLHQYWYGTPNDSGELTGIADFKQDAPGDDGKFVPEKS